MTICAAGRRLFPETRELLDEEEEISGELTITNTEIASSLPLQMLLYFNVQFSVFWGLMTLALMVFKVSLHVYLCMYAYLLDAHTSGVRVCVCIRKVISTSTQNT